MNEKIFPLLGFARKANKLSLGHDAAISAVVKNSAKLCILCADASDRLKKEFAHACSFDNKNIEIALLDCSMTDISKAVGSKCAVLSVNDEGFANAIKKLLD